MDQAPRDRVSGLLYREMTISDIPAGLRLCRAARWNQLEPDWRVFLEARPGGFEGSGRAVEVTGLSARGGLQHPGGGHLVRSTDFLPAIGCFW